MRGCVCGGVIVMLLFACSIICVIVVLTYVVVILVGLVIRASFIAWSCDHAIVCVGAVVDVAYLVIALIIAC